LHSNTKDKSVQSLFFFSSYILAGNCTPTIFPKHRMVLVKNANGVVYDSMRPMAVKGRPPKRQVAVKSSYIPRSQRRIKRRRRNQIIGDIINKGRRKLPGWITKKKRPYVRKKPYCPRCPDSTKTGGRCKNRVCGNRTKCWPHSRKTNSTLKRQRRNQVIGEIIDED